MIKSESENTPEETGRVIEVKGDNVVVSMIRSDACSRCKACNKGRSDNEMIVEAKNMCDAEVNDIVSVELLQNDFLNAVLIAYGLPLCMFFVGCFAGYYGAEYFGLSSYKEIIAFGLGVALVAVAYFTIRLLSVSGKWSEDKFVPVVRQKK